MTFAEFEASLSGDAPPPDASVALQALWRAHGQTDAAAPAWEAAHKLAQADEGADAAWVHAHLHRIEGDLRNAGYWYRRAGKPEATDGLAEEWSQIAQALLAAK